MISASILVIDDDVASACYLKRLLTSEGHHVRLVHGADAGLAICEAAPPPDEALEVLTDEADKGWRDRALVDAFVECREKEGTRGRGRDQRS